MPENIKPATDMLAAVVTEVSDTQLGDPTPCAGRTVADLLDHVSGVCLAFTAAAAKDPGPGSQGPSADGSRLVPDWRTQIPARLAQLAAAWQDDAAWGGMTMAGGLELPGKVAGQVAVNEVIVHGWDIAAATGQQYSCDPALIELAYGFVQPAVTQNPTGTPGLFGPPVSVPVNAPVLDRLIGLTGRDPSWRPRSG